MFRILMVLLIFSSSYSLGNSNDTSFVRKIKELEKVNNQLNTHINQLKYKLDSLSDNYKDFKSVSSANDNAVWQYGGSLVGIILAIIVLFGIIFNFSSTQAANKVFQSNYGYYSDKLKELEKLQEKCMDELDVISTYSETIKDMIKNKDLKSDITQNYNK